jgi:Sulfotransferase family
MSQILNTEVLLAQAERQTGFTDYGDDTFRSRFGQAVEYLDSVGMNDEGQRAAAAVCAWLLTSRLEFFADRQRYPIPAERIEKPLFATGEARSGTTLLHALLSVDPNGRALRFWEVMNPSPPPGLAAADDPRRARADADWREILQKIPKWLVSHPYNDMLGEGLPECERTWAFDFRVMTPTAWWRVPMPMKISGLPLDAHAQYRLHKMMLQQCQYARPKKYWVLKGFHAPRLQALFDTYPDARIIWVHRDPVQITASRIALTGELEEALVGHVNWHDLARIHLAATRSGLQRVLDDPLSSDPRIHHVRYTDFTADPVGTIRGFYEKFGVPFGGDAEAAMQTYLKNNHSDRYGKFRYSTDQIGVDVSALHAEFEPYRRRFGLDIEQRR